MTFIFTPALDWRLVLFILFLLFALLGLCASFRQRPFVVFLWLPATCSFAYAALSLSVRLAALSQLRDSTGFAGLAVIFLAPALAFCFAGLAVAFLARPARAVWRPWNTMPAAALCLASFFIADYQNGSHFDIQLSDSAGKSLSQVRVESTLTENGLQLSRGDLAVSTKGRLRLHLRRGQTVALKFLPVSGAPLGVHHSPIPWAVRIQTMYDSPRLFEIRHGWDARVANQLLRQGFAETVPVTRNIQLALTLPPYQSLDPESLREKIRQTLLLYKHSLPRGLNHGYICRNFASIDLIPLLINTYRESDKERDSVIEGLKEVADLLREVNIGCTELQRWVRFEPSYSKKRIADESAQLCDWAHVTYQPGDDPDAALRLVQQRIAAHAQLIIDFAVSEAAHYEAILRSLQQLRELGHPALPHLIEMLLANPPVKSRSFFLWSHTLWSIGAHFSELQPLANSVNPNLILLVCEAIPNGELEGAVAERLAQQLEEGREQMSVDLATRAEMYLKRLHARSDTKRKDRPR